MAESKKVLDTILAEEARNAVENLNEHLKQLDAAGMKYNLSGKDIEISPDKKITGAQITITKEV